MDYASHYQHLVSRAIGRTIHGYSERHHIVPRCLGGADDRSNLVVLTPEEHYVAHQLLVKMYPKHRGLAHAAVQMSKRCKGRKAYGWLRRRHIEALRIAGKGKTHSPESRAKIAAARRGKPTTLGIKRPPFSPEWRAKISAANKGVKRSFSAKHRANIGRASSGRECTADTRSKIAASNRGKHLQDPISGRFLQPAGLGETAGSG